MVDASLWPSHWNYFLTFSLPILTVLCLHIYHNEKIGLVLWIIDINLYPTTLLWLTRAILTQILMLASSLSFGHSGSILNFWNDGTI